MVVMAVVMDVVGFAVLVGDLAVSVIVSDVIVVVMVMVAVGMIVISLAVLVGDLAVSVIVSDVIVGGQC